MAILKIARMGHPVLVRRAEPVPDPTAPEIRRLIADMVETMEDANGAGLAAPQVHVPLRLFVFRVPAHRASGEADDAPEGVAALINPTVEPLGDETRLSWEGCLSIPGMRAAVRRPARVRYAGVDHEGRKVEREAGGFHARVVQHEYDHLDGILYPMRMTDFSLFGFNEELDRVAQAAAQAQAQAGTAA
jgi:peptide deformylase